MSFSFFTSELNMNVNTQFAVAIHILVYLAKNPDEPQGSALLASSIGTNPVVVRKISQKLQAANLVRSTAGKSGGLELSGPPERLTLWSLFEAVNGKEMFSIHTDSHPNCPVGSKMPEVLESTFSAVQESMAVSLKGVSIADLVSKIG